MMYFKFLLEIDLAQGSPNSYKTGYGKHVIKDKA